MKKQILILAAASTMALAGCAKTRTEGGTDGVTHWLAECESSAECGELECLCGMCTTACDDNAGCSMLGASAECAAPSDASCTGPAQICQPPTSSMPMPLDDSGVGGVGGAGGVGGVGGVGGMGGLVAQDAGGAGPMDSGPIEVDEPAVCKRMDARSAGTFCGGIAGYAWDGLKCKEVLCTCAGTDCDEIYPAATDCEAATYECVPPTMCVETSDCMLKSAECCQCGPVRYEDVHAVSSYQLDTHTDRTCDGRDCAPCEDGTDPLVNARKQFVATCGSAVRWEGGECGALDLVRLSCTQEEGCSVRVARCCQCGADPSVDELFAMPTGQDSDGLFCDTGQGCCEGEPNLPENVAARCGSSGFCELLLNGRVILPGNP